MKSNFKTTNKGMKKSRFTESQIVKSLKDQESGMKVSDICRSLGVSDATFYHWKSKYGDMEASDVKGKRE